MSCRTHHRDSNPVAALPSDESLPRPHAVAVDPGHPFPYIHSNPQPLAGDPHGGPGRKGGSASRVKVPEVLPRFLQIEPSIFVLLEPRIAANLRTWGSFLGHDISRDAPVRVTRDPDLELQEDEADDLMLALERSSGGRRLARQFRLEVDKADAGIDAAGP